MTKRAGAPVLMVCLMLGCGGDDDGGGGPDAATGGADAREQADSAPVGCAEAPAGTVNGTVDGEMVDPIAAAYSRPHPTVSYAHLIMIDEDAASSCADPDGDTGQRMQFILCDAPAVAEYEIVTNDALPTEACPGERLATALLEDGNGADRGNADSGTLTIESLDDCLSASFAVTFDTGIVDGDVVATVCE